MRKDGDFLSTGLAHLTLMHCLVSGLNSFRLRSILTLGLAAGLATACAPATRQQASDLTLPKSKHQLITGALKQTNEKIQQSPYAEACDQKNAALKEELIEAIETHLGKSIPGPTAPGSSAIEIPKDDPTVVPFADGYLVKIEKRKQNSTEWRNTRYSWKKVHDTYLELKEKARPEDWSWMNKLVRSLLTDDLGRVLAHKNLAITKDNVKWISVFAEKSELCRKNTECFAFNFSSEELEAMQQFPLYVHFLKKMQKATTNERRREVVEAMTKFIAIDASLNTSHVTADVKISTEGEIKLFSLALDGSSFNDSERAFLKDSIESIWKNDHAQVRLDWKIKSAALDLFQFFFHSALGSRAYVSQAKKEIHLYSQTSNRAIAHEFGHSIGFADHYYTLWDATTCEYTNQISEIDLMSIAESGDVTSEEWSDLDRLYSVDHANTN